MDTPDRELLAKRLSKRMEVDPDTAVTWLDAVFETVYEKIKAGESVTVKNFGRFYVKPGQESWIFKFDPGQRLRKLFHWSSTYKGQL